MALKIEQATRGLHVTHLTFAYPKGPKVLDEMSFTVETGSRVLIAGATGSGKSTLLRCLKPELTPHGTLSGSVLIDGQDTRELNAQISAGSIGFVMQDPRQQIVMDTVKAELAFGLENLATPPELIQRRVAEIAHYFGITAWVERSCGELSGGEAQIVNLAAVIAMQPRTLLLDEPTAMLDPIAAREFIELVERVNDELGITVVLVEHRQEDLLNTMNQVLYLEDGRLAYDGRPRQFAQWMFDSAHSNRKALPVAAQLYFMRIESLGALDQDEELIPEDVEPEEPLGEEPLGEGGGFTTFDDRPRFSTIPLEVREGRWWLWQHKSEVASMFGATITPQVVAHKDCAIEVRHLWYRYSKEEPYVLKDLSFKVACGSILGIVGANASGKSTVLSLLSGISKPQHGKVLQTAHLRACMLPQDPTTLFLCDTVLEDLMDHAESFGYGSAEVEALLKRMGLTDKTARHPFDLSGGEQQKLALAKLLLTKPDILLLDEPTKGLDSLALAELNGILKQESASGKTIVLVSHDLEFVARAADECLMLFDGEAVGRARTAEFFAGNMFYTTALQRITQGILDNCPPVLDWQEFLKDRGASSTREAPDAGAAAFVDAATIAGLEPFADAATIAGEALGI